MQPQKRSPLPINSWVFVLAFLAGIMLVVWIELTPAGLLGKADAIGYAVCHRIDERSFHIGDRQLPLCARCTGMYLGALLGLVYQARLGKKGGMPSLKFSIGLGLAFVLFAIDGANSYFHLIPGAPTFYEPQNWMRLATGTGLGLGMAAVLWPVFHQSMWTNWSSQPLLSTWRQMAELIVLAIAINLLVLTENPLILYPVALLSAATVLGLLLIIYCIVWVMAFKRDNQHILFRQISVFLLAGFMTALAQVALSDLGRYYLTGTWNGFIIN